MSTSKQPAVANAPAVLRADDPRRRELEARGWTVSARSWGARLACDRVDRERLRALAARAEVVGTVRELCEADAAAILELDAATASDYPGGIATSHDPLTAASVVLTPRRRAFGVMGEGEELLAMTFVDLDGARAEIDFTVVAAPWRGRGLATALKAVSVLALLLDGVQAVRTGGAGDNVAIIRANAAIGFVVDEWWVTMTVPMQGSWPAAAPLPVGRSAAKDA